MSGGVDKLSHKTLSLSILFTILKGLTIKVSPFCVYGVTKYNQMAIQSVYF